MHWIALSGQPASTLSPSPFFWKEETGPFSLPTTVPTSRQINPANLYQNLFPSPLSWGEDPTPLQPQLSYDGLYFARLGIMITTWGTVLETSLLLFLFLYKEI
jgi:hypothetical protein